MGPHPPQREALRPREGFCGKRVPRPQPQEHRALLLAGSKGQSLGKDAHAPAADFSTIVCHPVWDASNSYTHQNCIRGRDAFPKGIQGTVRKRRSMLGSPQQTLCALHRS